jgi:ribulose-phosphate 3-epimerase|tara:strand:+ start:533 stop:1177 length:645 start_codon:yes stop_codon:yes gene_type:complete
MTSIVPTVLATTPDEYKASLERVHTFVTRVHLDFSDGTLAPTSTIPVNQLWWPQEWMADIHVMAADPAAYVDLLISMKPHMIIFHAETQSDLLPVMQKVRAGGIMAGLSLMRSTVPADVSALIEAADHVMIFSGELGKYGGTASMMQLEKVRLIKRINNGVEIGWDGGVTAENAFSLSQGGVDVLYVGGAIQKAADPETAFNTMMKEVNKQGAM